ncbi:hypothetical protein [Halorarum halobium]|uniref:hypothetical protein n=1 Tax=Halorarum halobium TaxID=3075121 RepID=UPI0028AE8D13|nr:hypothetical protein [Halobaculum sp. XH14]
MEASGLRNVVEDRRLNAAIGWSVLLLISAVALGELFAGQAVWGVFVLLVVVVALVPPTAFRDATAMLPWEVVLFAGLPAVGRVFVAGQTVAGITFTGRVITYLAVASVALIVAVEMDVFTPVRMSHTFAVFFVTITTMAAAGIWAVLRYVSDLFLGSEFLLGGRPEAVVEHALMLDFVAATLAGVIAGLLFEFYFRRRSRAEIRVPVEVPDS